MKDLISYFSGYLEDNAESLEFLKEAQGRITRNELNFLKENSIRCNYVLHISANEFNSRTIDVIKDLYKNRESFLTLKNLGLVDASLGRMFYDTKDDFGTILKTLASKECLTNLLSLIIFSLDNARRYPEVIDKLERSTSEEITGFPKVFLAPGNKPLLVQQSSSNSFNNLPSNGNTKIQPSALMGLFENSGKYIIDSIKYLLRPEILPHFHALIGSVAKVIYPYSKEDVYGLGFQHRKLFFALRNSEESILQCLEQLLSPDNWDNTRAFFAEDNHIIDLERKEGQPEYQKRQTQGLGFTPEHLIRILQDFDSSKAEILEFLLSPNNWHNITSVFKAAGKTVTINGKQVVGLGFSSTELVNIMTHLQAEDSNISFKTIISELLLTHSSSLQKKIYALKAQYKAKKTVQSKGTKLTDKEQALDCGTFFVEECDQNHLFRKHVKKSLVRCHRDLQLYTYRLCESQISTYTATNDIGDRRIIAEDIEYIYNDSLFRDDNTSGLGFEISEKSTEIIKSLLQKIEKSQVQKDKLLKRIKAKEWKIMRKVYKIELANPSQQEDHTLEEEMSNPEEESFSPINNQDSSDQLPTVRNPLPVATNSLPLDTIPSGSEPQVQLDTQFSQRPTNSNADNYATDCSMDNIAIDITDNPNVPILINGNNFTATNANTFATGNTAIGTDIFATANGLNNFATDNTTNNTDTFANAGTLATGSTTIGTNDLTTDIIDNFIATIANNTDTFATGDATIGTNDFTAGSANDFTTTNAGNFAAISTTSGLENFTTNDYSFQPQAQMDTQLSQYSTNNGASNNATGNINNFATDNVTNSSFTNPSQMDYSLQSQSQFQSIDNNPYPGYSNATNACPLLSGLLNNSVTQSDNPPYQDPYGNASYNPNYYATNTNNPASATVSSFNAQNSTGNQSYDQQQNIQGTDIANAIYLPSDSLSDYASTDSSTDASTDSSTDASTDSSQQFSSSQTQGNAGNLTKKFSVPSISADISLANPCQLEDSGQITPQYNQTQDNTKRNLTNKFSVPSISTDISLADPCQLEDSCQITSQYNQTQSNTYTPQYIPYDINKKFVKETQAQPTQTQSTQCTPNAAEAMFASGGNYPSADYSTRSFTPKLSKSKIPTDKNTPSLAEIDMSELLNMTGSADMTDPTSLNQSQEPKATQSSSQSFVQTQLQQTQTQGSAYAPQYIPCDINKEFVEKTQAKPIQAQSVQYARNAEAMFASEGNYPSTDYSIRCLTPKLSKSKIPTDKNALPADGITAKGTINKYNKSNTSELRDILDSTTPSKPQNPQVAKGSNTKSSSNLKKRKRTSSSAMQWQNITRPAPSDPSKLSFPDSANAPLQIQKREGFTLEESIPPYQITRSFLQYCKVKPHEKRKSEPISSTKITYL